VPIVKQSWVKTPEALEKYLAKDRDAETITTASDGVSEEMASAIRDEHEKHGKNVKNLALTIIQSWHEKESDLFPPEKYNQMGQELANRIAPGHLAWVVTHTEKNHIHNHIVICSVNSETGKSLKNKKAELRKLHDANNAIARENGFMVLEPKTRAFEAKLPQNAKSAVAHGNKSWRFDLIQKADFSRAASTSFDEYVATLDGLGVRARVEEKNISYLYGDQKKAIRGKSLGTKFNKEGLMKAFKENDERFARDPGLRDRIRADLGAAFDRKGNSVGTPSNLLLESASYPGLGKKDYSQFTKINRRGAPRELPAIFDERGGILHQEMKKAKGVSILDYCKEHKIKTTVNDKGQTVLHGKEFIVLSASSWKNTKNGTQGTVIDFVAIHDESNYLRAVAKLNRNPRLLLLEPNMGEFKRAYQAFYIPKPKEASPTQAKHTLSRLLQSRGAKEGAADALLKMKNVRIGVDASILFMDEKGESALEFKEAPHGKWRTKRHGKPSGAFVERIGSSKKMVVFRDPFEFALHHEKGAAPSLGGASLFVMFDESSNRRLDELLALNPHIQEIHVARPALAVAQRGRSEVHEMNKRFNPFDIHVKELSLAGHDRGRSHGPDIGM
jgi:Relaxase/Mobilisation nuclease domain